jgi:hypothetical protein
VESDRPDSPRFLVSVAEILIVVAILSGVCAFLLPAVNAARGLRHRPPLLPQLQSLHEDNPWPFVIGTPIVVTAIVATFLGIARVLLPKTVRAHFFWKKAPVSKSNRSRTGPGRISLKSRNNQGQTSAD